MVSPVAGEIISRSPRSYVAILTIWEIACRVSSGERRSPLSGECRARRVFVQLGTTKEVRNCRRDRFHRNASGASQASDLTEPGFAVRGARFKETASA